MFKKISDISLSKYYWLGLLILAVSLEVSALFYQYVLGYLPCVLCIHVRILVFAIMLVAAFAFAYLKKKYVVFISQLLMVLLSAALFERSYQLLGTERGFVFGDCNMESGLPVWFALDRWIPSVFKVWEACGYTPELLFGITMSEALIVLSAILLLLSSAMLLVLFFRRDYKKT
ncbi:MAG: disulfide bond formation protein B [Gammaproteobacteria bacterium]|nr:disulfide bond formation protein B [Gammaproteobacteria bacterium]